ncbi:MAG: hypothetical protein R2879_11575 [Saprospiraceae bacterium]
MKIIKGILDFLFYGNLWIAFCAVAMVLQTEYLLEGRLYFSNFSLFVFFATSFLYGFHRVMGLKKLSAFLDKGRFVTINYRKTDIFIIAAIAGVAAIWYFFQLKWHTQLALIVPAIISLGYVFPILGPYGRLRDLNYIKIFLIAITWAFISTTLPFYESESTDHLFGAILFTERFLFVLAITIPFDIRDYQIDSHSKVKTIPTSMGVRKSIQLAGVILFLEIVLILFATKLGYYPTGFVVGLIVNILSTFYFIRLSPKIEHDYYFTGLMDGTMILQFFLTVGIEMLI